MKGHRNDLMGLTGLALVVGFFLPWIDAGSGVSGWDLASSDSLSLVTRGVLLLCPLAGVVLGLAAMGRSRTAGALSLATGAGVLGYTFYKLAYGFLAVTGIGLWLVLAAGAAGIVLGLVSRRGQGRPGAA